MEQLSFDMERYKAASATIFIGADDKEVGYTTLNLAFHRLNGEDEGEKGSNCSGPLNFYTCGEDDSTLIG